MRDPLTIQAGELRTPVTVQTKSTTKDSFGQSQNTWVDVLTTRAKIRTLTLNEKFSTSGFTGQATHQIVLRYQSATALTPGARIVTATKTFIVQSLENVMERNRVVIVLALEMEPTP